MKRCEALTLQEEGDLVDVKAPDWQGGRGYRCKVLVVSSRGGVFVTGGSWANQWGDLGRWTQYHHVVALGRREELTETERARQRREVERYQLVREQSRQKARKNYLRNRIPQELYNFVWDELEDAEGRALEALQAKARARLTGRCRDVAADWPSAWLQRKSSVLEDAATESG